MAVEILYKDSPILRHWRNYHFNMAISTVHYQVFYAPFEDLPKTTSHKETDIDRNLLLKLIRVTGIEAIQIQPYRLGIQVGRAFDYQPILIEIEGIIAEVFNNPTISPLS